MHFNLRTVVRSLWSEVVDTDSDTGQATGATRQRRLVLRRDVFVPRLRGVLRASEVAPLAAAAVERVVGARLGEVRELECGLVELGEGRGPGGGLDPVVGGGGGGGGGGQLDGDADGELPAEHAESDGDLDAVRDVEEVAVGEEGGGERGRDGEGELAAHVAAARAVLLVGGRRQGAPVVAHRVAAERDALLQLGGDGGDAVMATLRHDVDAYANMLPDGVDGAAEPRQHGARTGAGAAQRLQLLAVRHRLGRRRRRRQHREGAARRLCDTPADHDVGDRRVRDVQQAAASDVRTRHRRRQLRRQHHAERRLVPARRQRHRRRAARRLDDRDALRQVRLAAGRRDERQAVAEHLHDAGAGEDKLDGGDTQLRPHGQRHLAADHVTRAIRAGRRQQHLQRTPTANQLRRRQLSGEITLLRDNFSAIFFNTFQRVISEEKT